jgi:hypothetical protein
MWEVDLGTPGRRVAVARVRWLEWVMWEGSLKRKVEGQNLWMAQLLYGGRVAPGASQALVEVERVMGIEPTCEAWKASVLPLNYTRKGCGTE